MNDLASDCCGAPPETDPDGHGIATCSGCREAAYFPRPDYRKSCREGEDAVRGIYVGLGLTLAVAGGFTLSLGSVPQGAGLAIAATVLGVAAYRVKA